MLLVLVHLLVWVGQIEVTVTEMALTTEPVMSAGQHSAVAEHSQQQQQQQYRTGLKRLATTLKMKLMKVKWARTTKEKEAPFKGTRSLPCAEVKIASLVSHIGRSTWKVATMLTAVAMKNASFEKIGNDEDFGTHVRETIIAHASGENLQSSPWVSASLEQSEGFWSGAKSILLPDVNKPSAVIIEIIVNLSSLESEDLSAKAGVTEILLESVPKEALAGRYWMIRPGTPDGDRILQMKGGDQRWPDPKTKEWHFASFARWKSEGWEKVAYTEAKEKKVLEGCLERDRHNLVREGVVVDGRRKRQPTKKAAQSSQTSK
jgi:hypothetical protein